MVSSGIFSAWAVMTFEADFSSVLSNVRTLFMNPE